MKKIIILVFILSAAVRMHAQTLMTGRAIVDYINKLPEVAGTPQQAYDWNYVKGKRNPAMAVREELQAQLNILADRSAHKSILLSQLSKRIDKEDSKYDFSKVKNNVDKVLEEEARQANADFHAALDNYVRAVNSAYDSAGKISAYSTRAAFILNVQKRRLPQLEQQTKKLTLNFLNYLDKKKYNEVLDNNNSSHPYYIQLLEIRGLLFDHLMMINDIVEGANLAAADMVVYCKEHPQECK